MIREKNSIIIIGAGLSGLTAADEILSSQPILKIIILEAMSQPGGRTQTIDVQGVKYDLGGQWFGTCHKHVQKLGQRAKSQVMIQNIEGNYIYQYGDLFLVSQEQISQFGSEADKEYNQVVEKLDQMANTVPLNYPNTCPFAKEWDSITLYSWIQQNIKSPRVKLLFQILSRSCNGCETNQISLLYFLHFVNQSNGIQFVMDTSEGLEHFKFVKGTQPLSLFLQKEIKTKGGQIFYNTLVTSIEQNQSGVVVSTRDGKTYKSEFLICSVPIPMIKKIQFMPQLSRERRFINDRYIMGAFSKVILIYDKSYWRDNGFSGQVLTDCKNSPVLATFDETRKNQKGELVPAMLVLLGGSVEEQWIKDKQYLIKMVQQKLASLFQSPQMLKPVKVITKFWNQQETFGGAPCGYVPPGVLSKIADIRKPEGRIHWAGTQTALISQGYMNGAIQSGIRVSKQLIQRIKGKQLIEQAVIPNPKKYISLHNTYKNTVQ